MSLIQSIDTLKPLIVPILRSKGVLKSAVFGSYARGEATQDSDLDILVELPDAADMYDLIDLKQSIEDVVRIPTDVITYRSVHPLLKRYILADQIQLL